MLLKKEQKDTGPDGKMTPLDILTLITLYHLQRSFWASVSFDAKQCCRLYCGRIIARRQPSGYRLFHGIK